jgi:tetratricopeptide (TPR) repeat protein
VTNTSGGRRGSDGASKRGGERGSARGSGGGRGAGSGAAGKSGASGRGRSGRDPGLLPLLGPDDDRPYARAPKPRDGSGGSRSGRRPLGDRAQSGVRKRATGADGPDQSRKRAGRRDDQQRGGSGAASARSQGEVTGPFTRRRVAEAPVEEKRPALRLASGGKAGSAAGAKPATRSKPATAPDRARSKPASARGRAKTATKAPSGEAAAVRKRRRPTEATEELRRLAGGNANRAVDTLARASEAFARGRERDALRILRPLTEAYPTAVAVRELAGLCRYRIGSYAAAADDLAAFAELSGSTEQHPVLMDCRRAQGKLRDVEELWEELRETSPSAALVTEGRIVVAGALADAGRLSDAIDLLARRAEVPGRTKEHTVRLWYALADLEERAGDVPRARALFEQVQRFDAEFADVAERLAALS